MCFQLTIISLKTISRFLEYVCLVAFSNFVIIVLNRIKLTTLQLHYSSIKIKTIKYSTPYLGGIPVVTCCWFSVVVVTDPWLWQCWFCFGPGFVTTRSTWYVDVHPGCVLIAGKLKACTLQELLTKRLVDLAWLNTKIKWWFPPHPPPDPSWV